MLSLRHSFTEFHEGGDHICSVGHYAWETALSKCVINDEWIDEWMNEEHYKTKSEKQGWGVRI